MCVSYVCPTSAAFDLYIGGKGKGMGVLVLIHCQQDDDASVSCLLIMMLCVFMAILRSISVTCLVSSGV